MANKTLPTLQNGVVPVSGDKLLMREANAADPTQDSGVTVDQLKIFMQAGQPQVVASYAGINAFTVANTLVYTVPTGKTLIVTGVYLRVTAASAVTAGPTVGIGNAAGTSNIYTAQATGSSFNTTNSVYVFPLAGGASLSVSAGGTVYLNNTVAATGTSETYSADLIGYLV